MLTSPVVGTGRYIGYRSCCQPGELRSSCEAPRSLIRQAILGETDARRSAGTSDEVGVDIATSQVVARSRSRPAAPYISSRLIDDT